MGSGPRMFRKRTSWCWNIRPEIPTPAVKHHTVMADGTYMSHDWCLIVAVDGETGEALGFQWCSHESKDAYAALFSRIPAPDVLVTDGLRGAESACTEVWPGARIQRCLVHVQRNTRAVFCQVGVGRFGVSFSPCERRVSGRFGVGRSCWLLVIALVIA